MRLLELAAASARVTIAPEIGGSIAAFEVAGRPVLRPAPQAALDAHDVRALGCYPLVPYSNRIRDASLRFGDARFALARNFGDHPHSIHGVGWQRAWTVVDAASDRARLALAHDARGRAAHAWPWAFEATQAFHLSAPTTHDARAVLLATLTLRNRGSEPFPFGLGFHPFFPKTANTRLRFAADRVWRNDPTQLPQALVDIPPPWRFEASRALGAIALDNVFTGWRGTAELVDDANRTSIRLDADRALAFLVVYAPAGGDCVAVEPVTHETDAFNRSAAGAERTGTRVLPPGAVFSCTMRIAAAVVADAVSASSVR